MPSVLIACPVRAGANDGLWYTALRWSRMLRGHCRTAIAERWHGEPHDLLLALGARRTAASVAEWSAAHPPRASIVALTGTDLYRDILFDAEAQHALQHATRLVVPEPEATRQLSAPMRAKCHLVVASARPLRPVPPPRARLRAIQVAHLTEDEDPLTFLRALRRLPDRADIEFQHVGEAADPTLAAAARRTAAECPHYRWFGALPRGQARQRIRHAQLLVSTSRLDAGGQVIAEAAQSGTAVVASRIPGHLGLLGRDHAGYFDPGDDAALARLVERARDDRAFLAQLTRQTTARAALFDPADEQRRLVAVVREALEAVA